MNKRTKIVCTIGPASWDPEIMKGMIENGMNCARLNGAFADPDEMDKVQKLVRQFSDKVSLMLDVKGPEIRMNKFPKPIELSEGDKVEIGDNDSSNIYPSNYQGLYKFVHSGQKVIVGDGDIEMSVDDVIGDKIICTVKKPGVLKPGKALNLPGCEYASEVLTDKDKRNIDHAIKTGWDIISPSFIEDSSSVMQVKDYLKGTELKIVSKIESQKGIENIEEILEVTDGILVARGGLGVELGLAKVPNAQRILIEKAKKAGQPVITATQMLESMLENSSPTRAEANDIVTAIEEGTDAIMLSGESAAGKYPVEAVKFMSSIAKEAEESVFPLIVDSFPKHVSITGAAISKAAAEMAIDMKGQIEKILVVSKTGNMARLLARHNLSQPIYAFVSKNIYARMLTISKNITDVFEQDPSLGDRDEAIDMIIEKSKNLGIVKPGQTILLLCKTPLNGEKYFPNIFEVITVN